MGWGTDGEATLWLCAGGWGCIIGVYLEGGIDVWYFLISFPLPYKLVLKTCAVNCDRNIHQLDNKPQFWPLLFKPLWLLNSHTSQPSTLDFHSPLISFTSHSPILAIIPNPLLSACVNYLTINLISHPLLTISPAPLPETHDPRTPKPTMTGTACSPLAYN
jgi:hypothetical protein